MLTPSWVQTLKEWQPIIEIVTLLALLKYAWDTAGIKRASISQSESAHQPLLVLEYAVRDATDQILSQSIEPTPATELANQLLIRNIGAGPAYSIVFIFKGVESVEAFRSNIPCLEAGRTFKPAISKSFIKRGHIQFEATYSGLSHTRFQSRQLLNDGVLGFFTMTKYGVLRRSLAFFKGVNLLVRTRAEDRRTRKRIAALYPE